MADQDLADGESTQVPGSGSAVYTLTNTGGVYSCTCPAWKHQGAPIEKRTCKHLKRYRGEQAEKDRVGGFFTPTKKVSAAQQAKDAAKPKLLLAHKWDGVTDVTGWWMSEKLDGVRAFWTGETFLSRLGNEFMAPTWFTDELGSEPLDGELWVDRGEFQRTVSIVRRQDRSDHWQEVRFVVFDAPGQGKHRFEDRVDFVQEHVEGMEWTSALAHIPCKGEKHLRDELARIEGLGGEGLMLRQPESKYVAGRSTSLLKVKTFHDAEGVVVGHVPGKGKHKGRCGALILERPDGTRFNVGTGMSDKERENPPDVGAVVTYRYQELTKAGVPRFPSFIVVRIDLTMTVPSLSGGAPKKAPKKPTVAKSKAAGGAAAGETRYFEYVDTKSSKFWAITTHGTTHTVRYGRIGSAGSSKTKDFADVATMEASAAKLVLSKTGKGYVEKDTPADFAGADLAGASVPLATPSTKKAPAKKTKPKATSSKKTKPTKSAPPKQPAITPAPAGGRTRYFLKGTGAKAKFWEIVLDGNQHTVRFGRVGTNGARRTHAFPSKGAMTASAEVLVQKRLAMGYAEA